MLYVIAWLSKTTGTMGQGTATYSLAGAQEICRQFNGKYPDLVHYPVSVSDDDDIMPRQTEPDPEWGQQDEDNWVYQQITK